MSQFPWTLVRGETLRTLAKEVGLPFQGLRKHELIQHLQQAETQRVPPTLKRQRSLSAHTPAKRAHYQDILVPLPPSSPSPPPIRIPKTPGSTFFSHVEIPIRSTTSLSRRRRRSSSRPVVELTSLTRSRSRRKPDRENEPLPPLYDPLVSSPEIQNLVLHPPTHEQNPDSSYWDTVPGPPRTPASRRSGRSASRGPTTTSAGASAAKKPRGRPRGRPRGSGRGGLSDRAGGADVASKPRGRSRGRPRKSVASDVPTPRGNITSVSRALSSSRPRPSLAISPAREVAQSQSPRRDQDQVDNQKSTHNANTYTPTPSSTAGALSRHPNGLSLGPSPSQARSSRVHTQAGTVRSPPKAPTKFLVKARAGLGASASGSGVGSDGGKLPSLLSSPSEDGNGNVGSASGLMKGRELDLARLRDERQSILGSRPRPQSSQSQPQQPRSQVKVQPTPQTQARPLPLPTTPTHAHTKSASQSQSRFGSQPKSHPRLHSQSQPQQRSPSLPPQPKTPTHTHVTNKLPLPLSPQPSSQQVGQFGPVPMLTPMTLESEKDVEGEGAHVGTSPVRNGDDDGTITENVNGKGEIISATSEMQVSAVLRLSHSPFPTPSPPALDHVSQDAVVYSLAVNDEVVDSGMQGMGIDEGADVELVSEEEGGDVYAGVDTDPVVEVAEDQDQEGEEPTTPVAGMSVSVGSVGVVTPVLSLNPESELGIEAEVTPVLEGDGSVIDEHEGKGELEELEAVDPEVEEGEEEEESKGGEELQVEVDLGLQFAMELGAGMRTPRTGERAEEEGEEEFDVDMDIDVDVEPLVGIGMTPGPEPDSDRIDHGLGMSDVGLEVSTTPQTENTSIEVGVGLITPVVGGRGSDDFRGRGMGRSTYVEGEEDEDDLGGVLVQGGLDFNELEEELARYREVEGHEGLDSELHEHGLHMPINGGGMVGRGGEDDEDELEYAAAFHGHTPHVGPSSTSLLNLTSTGGAMGPPTSVPPPSSTPGPATSTPGTGRVFTPITHGGHPHARRSDDRVYTAHGFGDEELEMPLPEPDSDERDQLGSSTPGLFESPSKGRDVLVRHRRGSSVSGSSGGARGHGRNGSVVTRVGGGERSTFYTHSRSQPSQSQPHPNSRLHSSSQSPFPNHSQPSYLSSRYTPASDTEDIFGIGSASQPLPRTPAPNGRGRGALRANLSAFNVPGSSRDGDVPGAPSRAENRLGNRDGSAIRAGSSSVRPAGRQGTRGTLADVTAPMRFTPGFTKKRYGGRRSRSQSRPRDVSSEGEEDEDV